MVPKEPSAPQSTPDESPQMGRDPIEDMFGTKAPGFIHTPSDDIDTVPEEVQAAIDSLGIDPSKRTFQCTLKRCHEGQHDTQGAYINSWRGTAPTLKEIALHYGPGRYLVTIYWKVSEYDDAKGKNVNRTKTETVPIIIDEAFRDMHEDFQIDMKIQLSARRREKLNKAKMSANLDKELSLFGDEGEGGGGPKNVKEYVNEITEMAQRLGMKPGGSGFSMEKVMPLIVPALSMIKEIGEANRARQDQFMAMMMQMMNQSNTQLVEVMKSQHGPSNGSEMMREMTNMVMSGIDLRKTIQDANQKESVVDKVFNLISDVAPVIVQLASMPKGQAQKTPVYGMAKGAMESMPEIEEIKKDENLLIDLVNRLDPQLGTRQVDAILELAEAKRPEACRGNYDTCPEMPPEASGQQSASSPGSDSQASSESSGQ